MKSNTLLGFLTCVLAATTLVAEDRIDWAPDFRTACELAAEQRRLVLLHFYNDNCPPCLRLDQNVFSQETVSDAIAQNYIPVKIHAGNNPQLATRYQIQRWPTDVIVTSSGLEIHRTVSPQKPEEYIAFVHQIAAQAGISSGRQWQSPLNHSKPAQLGSSAVAAAGQPAAPSPRPEFPTARPATPPTTTQYAAAAPALTQIPPLPPLRSQFVPGQAAAPTSPPGAPIENSFVASAPTATRFSPPTSAPLAPAPVASQPREPIAMPVAPFAEPTQIAVAPKPVAVVPQLPEAAPSQSSPAPSSIAVSPSPLAALPEPPAVSPQATIAATSPAATLPSSLAPAQSPPAATPPLPGAAASTPAPAPAPIAAAQTTPANAPSLLAAAPSPPVAAATPPAAVPVPITTPAPIATQPPVVTPAPIAAAPPVTAPPPVVVPPPVVTPPVAASQTSAIAQQSPPAQLAPVVPLLNANLVPASQAPPIALEGHCPVTLLEKASWEKGDPRIGAIHKESTFLFTSVEQRQRFLADPERYQLPPLAMEGYCPVTLHENMKWQKGDKQFFAVHRGRTYYLASAAERTKFMAAADSFAPMLSGCDVVRFAQKKELVEGKRAYGLMTKEKQIYLFADKQSLEQFEKSSDTYMTTARQAMLRTDTGAIYR